MSIHLESTCKMNGISNHPFCPIEPFQPARERQADEYMDSLRHLDNSWHITLEQQAVIRAVLTYTPNGELLDKFPEFDEALLLDLWEVSRRGMVGLRPLMAPLNEEDRPENDTLNSPSPDKFKRVDGFNVVGSRVVYALSIKKPLPDLDELIEKTQMPVDGVGMTRSPYYCELSGFGFDKVPRTTAHIFPYTGLVIDTAATWRFLAIFLGEELRDALLEELYECLHTAGNRLFLTSGLCVYFETGRFSVIPWGDEADSRYRDVWMALWTPAESMPCMTIKDDGRPRRFRHGEIIRISAEDGLPLPSKLLLWWHASIWRTTAAAGLSVTPDARKIQAEGKAEEEVVPSPMTEGSLSLEDECDSDTSESSTKGLEGQILTPPSSDDEEEDAATDNGEQDVAFREKLEEWARETFPLEVLGDAGLAAIDRYYNDRIPNDDSDDDDN
ncbi:hypothetical protein Dda_6438 [Drechslerella dactyloides]|uniref:Uncharacterized protein n=1 Tax=Drechslerella dactyloides TaxID=74499 RepID=A0AAD6NIX6_DREDA|nr:hypothetical protein Dda_6438 [Drechslerella dactyloides]